MFLQQEQNQYVCLVQLFLLQKTPQYLFF
jgi:hypothetical protein